MNHQGFSLIEIVFVIAIIAIFASFAYPGYRESIVRARRVDGQIALIELANQMENYYSKQQSYQGATLGTGSETDVLSSNQSAQRWYSLAISHQSSKDYHLIAIPQGAQALEDNACKTLHLDNFGRKSASSATNGPPKREAGNCW
ncbi:MAG: type IV pilin protein [Tatlockia sp.]|nr:type IV pilin protein [Tatlockia sp.]